MVLQLAARMKEYAASVGLGSRKNEIANRSCTNPDGGCSAPPAATTAAALPLSSDGHDRSSSDLKLKRTAMVMLPRLARRAARQIEKASLLY